jgi:iron complex outermembrane receptor protein
MAATFCLATGAAAFAQAPAGDDIIVTALRTESRASQTPVALSVIEPRQLRDHDVTDISTLDTLVPSLSIDRNNGIQITIRGVTSSDGTEKGDPSAAFLLDGIYIARPQAQDVSLFDLERIEVLRGPQGTLYGRNATAGVINVISARPIQAFAAGFDASYGNFDARNATGMVNFPVDDRVALRAAVNYDRRDSFIRRGAGGASLDPARDNLSGRLSALIDLSPGAELLLRADYASIKGATAGAVSLGNFFVLPVMADTDPRIVKLSSREQRTMSWPERPTSRDSNSWGLTADLKWDLGPLDLAYLGSYRRMKRDEQGSFLFGTHDSTYDGKYWQNSQELRLALNQGRLRGQIGAYYFKEKSQVGFFILAPEALGFPPNATRAGFAQDPTISESYAAFGEATFDVTPRLHVTGGVRFTHDRKTRRGATLFDLDDGSTITLQVNDARRTFGKTTWRLGLHYDLTDAGIVYATASTGYKAGGFNDGCEIGKGTACALPADALYYDPETLTAYEAGVKLRFAADRLRLNAALFHYDYSNLQLSQISNVCGGPCQVTTNAARAKVDGVEAEATFVPSDRHRLDLGATYLDARYDRFFPIENISFSGKQLDHTPKFTASAAYRYTQPLHNGGSIAAAARIRFSDHFMLTDLTPRVQFRQPHYHATDLSLTYNAPKDRFYVQAFVDNLENEIILSTATADFGGTATFNDPRRYGVRTGVRF